MESFFFFCEELFFWKVAFCDENLGRYVFKLLLCSQYSIVLARFTKIRVLTLVPQPDSLLKGNGFEILKFFCDCFN